MKLIVQITVLAVFSAFAGQAYVHQAVCGKNPFIAHFHSEGKRGSIPRDLYERQRKKHPLPGGVFPYPRVQIDSTCSCDENKHSVYSYKTLLFVCI